MPFSGAAAALSNLAQRAIVAQQGMATVNRRHLLYASGGSLASGARGRPSALTFDPADDGAQATALGLRHAFVNQPVEVSRLRPELGALVGLPGQRPDIVMRFGYGAALPYSARRPVSDVVA